MSERLADFLIIGAMKSGTTTLYRDLLTHSRIYFPRNKEPDNLTTDHVLTPVGRAEYAAHFDRAASTERCGDASTAYTKLPDFPGVPQRAVTVLPEGFKVIYVVREPVSRTVSQHYHEYSGGRMGGEIDNAIHEHERLIQYSRYAMQVEPWIEAIGRDRVHIVLFEEYVADRRATISAVCEFIGITPEPDRIEVDKVFNKGEGKAIATGGWTRIMSARWYRSLIRPILPLSIRDRLRHMLMPKAPPRPAPPSPSTVSRIIEMVRDDEVQLRAIMGRDKPLWDWQAVLARYHKQNPLTATTTGTSTSDKSQAQTSSSSHPITPTRDTAS